MDLPRMGLIAGNLIGTPPSDTPAILARYGATVHQWAEACARIATFDAADAERYRAATRDALAARLGADEGAAPALAFETFVAANVEARVTSDMAAAVRASGLPSEAHFYLASYRWTDRIGSDARLSARFDAGVIVGLARRDRPTLALPPPRAARRVRALACPRCGAHKRTEPRTAYVYCDFCAYLFDYDESTFAERHGVLPFHEAFRRLREGALPEIVRAWKARELDAYREAWSWVYDRDIELLPEGWPPRVAEAQYRRAIVAFSVACCEATHGDDSIRRARDACDAAWLASVGKPNAKRLVAYFRASLVALDARIAVYAAKNLFDLYPEHVAQDDFRRINLRISLRECLPNADARARAAILAEAGVSEDAYAEVPAVGLDACSCGRCGSALLVADGADRLVCESCGDVLDARAPRVPCPACGAPFIAVDGRSVACGHCGARMDVL